MKKILLSLGVSVAVIAPAASAIACSNEEAPTVSPTIVKKNKYEGVFSSLHKENRFLDSKLEVADSEFEDETGLTSVSLPAVKKIGSNAFENVVLTSISIPNAERIWNGAFQHAELTSLDIEKAIQIGEGSFTRSHLNSLVLPNAKDIGDYAFFYSELVSLSLPHIENIGESSFTASKLVSISFPSVKKIGEKAFFDSPLTSLYLPNVETIGKSAFEGVVNSPDTKITLPSKFDDPIELKRIFNGSNLGSFDRISFAWI